MSGFEELDKILNVAENAVMEREKPERIEPRKSNDELDTDYQYARENYYNVIERGHDALDELLMEATNNFGRGWHTTDRTMPGRGGGAPRQHRVTFSDERVYGGRNKKTTKKK